MYKYKLRKEDFNKMDQFVKVNPLTENDIKFPEVDANFSKIKKYNKLF